MVQSVAQPTGSVERLTPEELAEYPEFAEIPAKNWERMLKFYDLAITRRQFRPGDVICREGEYVYTAFYIHRGRAKAFLAAPMGHVNTAAKIGVASKSGALGALTGTLSRIEVRSILALDNEAPRLDRSTRQFIPIDATVDLAMDQREAVLGPGDLFGEMSCLSLYPRSATVTAIEPCVMFEMHRHVLEALKKTKKFKKLIEDTYRERALHTHLRSAPEFSDLPDRYIDELKAKVELCSFEPGESILSEGEQASGLYLIRIGFVQVLQKHPGGELVLTYWSRGQYFGEHSLLTREPSQVTCKALDHVEALRIDPATFADMVTRFPGLRRKLLETARRRAAVKPPVVPSTMELRLNELLKQGLMDAQNVLMIDLDRCTRCDECVHACAEAHDGVTRLLRDGLRYESFLVATSCRQCTDPMCMIGCPVGSIRRRESMEVVIEDWCIGCEKCVKNCPYGNITMHEFDTQKVQVYESQKVIEKEGPGGRKRAVVRKATTCDLCLDLPEPSCVYACPHEAAIRGNPAEIVRQKYQQRGERKEGGILISLGNLFKGMSRRPRTGRPDEPQAPPPAEESKVFRRLVREGDSKE